MFFGALLLNEASHSVCLTKNLYIKTFGQYKKKEKKNMQHFISASVYARVRYFLTVSFCFAEKRLVFIYVTRRALFFRRAREKTKSLIDHKKAQLQRKLIKTNVTDSLHGNFSFRAGLGERFFVYQITYLSLSTFETSVKTGRLGSQPALLIET